MKITTGFINIQGAPLEGENPLPMFRARCHDSHPVGNGTLKPEELERFGTDTGFRVLPYRIQDRYSRDKRSMDMACVIMENEFLKAEFLPEYGGRLWSLYDKKNNRELLFRNPVMQPANLAVRNAWFSGGIEWNVAQYGHTFTTCDKVFFAKVVNEEGYEFLRMYDYERTKGLLWQIDFHLPDDSRQLFAHVSIVNDMKEDVSMYWWTNIAVREEEGCRVFSSTKEVMYIEPKSLKQGSEHSFGHGTMPDLPVLPGKDASYPQNFPYSSEYFFQNGREQISPWESITYRDGSAFFERSTQPLRIRKMFCWGTHGGGQHWKDYLSVPGKGDYVEIQAGLAPTQLHTTVFSAGDVISFTQAFGGLMLDTEDTGDIAYDLAGMCVKTAINSALPTDKIVQMDERFHEMESLPCTKLLYTGSGWGALEQVRRMHENQPLFPRQFSFPAETAGPEQMMYMELICKHTLPELKGTELPAAFIVDKAYQPYLEECLERNSKDAMAHLLLGSLLYEDGQEEAGIAHWKEGLSIVNVPIFWRNLAFAAAQAGDNPRALSYMEEAHLDKWPDLDAAYYKEYFTYMLAAGKYTEMFACYQSLSEELKADESLYLKACEAAIEIDEFAFLEEAFKRDYALIREGETLIGDIWFAYAKKKGIPESEIPAHLDMRVSS